MDNPNKWNHRVISWSWCSVLYRKCFSIQRMWRVMINVSFWFVWNNLSCHPALLSTRLTAHFWATSVARVTTFWCDSPRLYREQAHAVQVSKPDRFYSWWIILYPIMVISPRCIWESKSSWCTREIKFKIFGWYSLLTQRAGPIHPSIKLIRVPENYWLFEVKRMISIPVFFKAAF